MRTQHSNNVPHPQAVDVIGGPEKTRRHVTIIDPKSDAAVTHVQVPGLPHPAALFVPGGPVMAAVARLAAPGVTIALSGSLPSGAPTHLYATLIETIRAKGGKVRPSLKQRFDCCPGALPEA